MSILQAIGSGIAGAITLTALHESLRQLAPDAPQLQKIGMQMTKRADKKSRWKKGKKNDIYNQALAGELAINSILYSLVGSKGNNWGRGALIGAGMGLAAVFLPQILNLDEKTSTRSGDTIAMTLGLYTLAGLTAAGVGSLLDGDDD